MVISKQERFNFKVSTAPISGLVELIELEIELVVGPNAPLDYGPDKTASSQVARVKGSCLLQNLVRGVLVICLAVKDWCTLSNLIVTRDILCVLQAEGNVITVRLGNDALANHRSEGGAISVMNHT